MGAQKHTIIKVNCTRCGVAIKESTAANNDGLCPKCVCYSGCYCSKCGGKITRTTSNKNAGMCKACRPPVKEL